MKRVRKFVTIKIISLLTVFLITPLYAADKSLSFGSVAMDIPAVMHKRLKPLTVYLSETLKMPVTLRLAPNMGVAISDTASGKVDLSYLTPVAYLKAREKGNAQLIAKTVTNGKASFQLMIVVKQDSPIKSIEDLAGKSFAFGDKKALLQRAVVKASGIELTQFSEYKYIGHYDNIARAVMNNDFDAGILKDTMALKWQNKGLRILYSSAELPPYNISASANVNKELQEKIKQAFLSLDSKNKKHLEIIKAVDKKYDGFAATNDAEYDVVRTLIAPFIK
ncbi:MAG: phosphate/phosphite/phosphonate ABC transporter substrate-binding protein [Gammaproteobacteria bacterium]|nr:phosphate/phosphite/phosphonate ABC transporter substrate-binding protein [Gammaproteobacteria bacterium]